LKNRNFAETAIGVAETIVLKYDLSDSIRVENYLIPGRQSRDASQGRIERGLRFER